MTKNAHTDREIKVQLTVNLKVMFGQYKLHTYRGFLRYATFGTWKKTALAKNRISKIFILCTQYTPAKISF